MKIPVHVNANTTLPAHIRKLVGEAAQSGTLAGRISCDDARA